MENQDLDKIKLDLTNLLILKDLLENKKVDYVKSSTIYELKVLQVLKYNTIFRRIQSLEKFGILKKGIKKSKKNTYYITKLGIDTLKNILKGDIGYEK